MEDQNVNDDLLSRAREQYATAGVPVGVNQAFDRGPSAFRDGDLVSRAQEWYGGRNTQGTESGYQTDFFKRSAEGYRKALDEGRARDYWSSADATGIITFDHTDNRSGRSFRAGDVYDRGERVGNLYGSFSKDEADLMMADLTLDATTKARAFSGHIMSGTVGEEVERVRREQQKEWEGYISQLDLQEKVEEKKESWGFWDNILAIGASALAGAATGSVAGPWGAVVGGGVGLFGGILNQDKLTSAAAYASVKQDMAHEQFGAPGGFTTGIREWSGLAMSYVGGTPVNLVQGGYDWIQGSVGDGVAEWDVFDPETGQSQRPGWVSGLGFASQFAGGWGAFASKTSRNAYTWTMTGHIGGTVAQPFTTGGKMFNESSAQFESILYDDNGDFSLGRFSSAVGMVGIDAVQLGTFRGLIRKTSDARALVGAKTGEKSLDALARRGAPKGTYQVQQNGRVYTVDRASGKAVSHRFSSSILAPSEMIGALSTRAIVWRGRARDAGAVTSDDIFRASQALAVGEKRIATIMVNAYGEGMEELTQAVLESTAFGGAMPDGWDLGEAAATGFAFGLGAGIPMVQGMPKMDDQMFANAALNLRITEGEQFNLERFEKQWRGLHFEQKRVMASRSPQEQAQLDAAAAIMAKDLSMDIAASTADQARLMEVLQLENASRLKRLTPRTDPVLRLVGTTTAKMPSHSVGLSIESLIFQLSQWNRGLQIQAEALGAAVRGEFIPQELWDNVDARGDLRAVLTESGKQLTALVNMARDAQRAYQESGRRDVTGLLALNETIKEWYSKSENQTGIDSSMDAGLRSLMIRARERAISLLFVRDPQTTSGSYLVLMPQVNLELSRRDGNNGMMISPALKKLNGMDFDGDNGRQLGQLLLTDEALLRERTGQAMFGATDAMESRVDSSGQVLDKPQEVIPEGASTQVAARGNEVNVSDIYEAFVSQSVNEPMKSAATNLVANIRKSLRSRYKDFIPVNQIDKYVDNFSRRLELKEPEAAQILIADMMRHQVAMARSAATGRENSRGEWQQDVNEVLWMDDMIHRNYEQLQTSFATLAQPEAESNSTTTAAPANPILGRYHAVRHQRGVLVAQELLLVFKNSTLFRGFGSAKYTSEASNVEGERSIDEMQLEMQQMIAALQGEYENTIGKLDESEKIERTVQVMLEKLVSQMGLTGVGGVALLGNTLVPENMDSSGDRYDGGITWTQWFLREQLNKFQRENSVAIQNSDALQRRLQDLRALTFPGGWDGAAMNATKAFSRVFGTWTMYELLGDSAPELGASLTLGQWVQMYTMQSTESRRTTSRILKDDSPLYKKRKDVGDLPFRLEQLEASDTNGITPYSTIVDVLLDVGNHRLSVDAAGVPLGEMAQASTRVHKDLFGGFQEFQAALEQAAKMYLGRSLKTEADVLELFNQYPDYALNALRLIPDTAILGGVYNVIRNDEGDVTGVVAARWVREMFLLSPDAALKSLWWNSTLSTWRAMGDKVADYDNLTNRIHQVMWNLSVEAGIGTFRLQQFISDMTEAQTVDDAVSLLNRKYRTDEMQPFVAWNNDVAEFTPGFSSSAFAGGDRTVSLAESAKIFRDKSRELNGFLDAERIASSADSVLIADIRSELKEKSRKKATRGQAYQKTGHKTTLDRLEIVINAAKHSGEPLGPGAFLDYTTRQLAELSPNSADKGISAKNVTSLGDYQAQSSDTVGFDTAFGRHANAVSSAYIGDLRGNPKLILQPLRIQGSDGEMILNWEGVTPESVVEASTEYPELMPIIRAALHPTIQDLVSLPDGSTILKRRMIGDGSLTSLLDAEYFQRLVTDDTLEGKMRYLSEVAVGTREFNGNGNEVIKFGNEVAVAHAFSSRKPIDSSAARSLSIQTYADIADLLRIAGIAAGKNTKDEQGNVISVLENAAAELVLERQKRVAKRLTDTTYIEVAQATLDYVAKATVADPASEVLRREASAILKDATEGKNVQKRVEAFKQKSSAYKDLQEQIETALSQNPFRMILQKFYIQDTMSKSEVADTRRNIADYIYINEGIQSQTASWALPVIQKVNAHLLAERGVAPDQKTLPRLSAAEWTTAMSAVITSAVTNETTIQADGHQPTPFPSDIKTEMAAAFDPTFMYLVRDLLDPSSPMVQSAKAIQDNYAWTPPRADWSKELLKRLQETVFHPDRLGPWNTDIPRHTIENGSSRPNSAGAHAGIQQAGLTPHNERTVGATTEYTFQKPEEHHHSNITLTAKELGSLASMDTLVSGAVKSPTGQDVPLTFPLSELNGRFARKALLRVTYPNGTNMDYALWDGTDASLTLDTPEGVPLDRGVILRDPTDPQTQAFPTEFGRSPQKEAIRKQGYRIVTLDNMRHSISLVKGYMNIPDDASFSLEMEYIHPASQPAETDWYNNIYFEGVPYELGGENFESLNSALNLGPGGLSQIYQDHALDSIKKLFLAIQVSPPPSKEDVTKMELGWETDLRTVIHLKAQHMMSSDTGGKKLAHHLYPAVFKDMKLVHIVRGFDAEGNPTAWTAEEVIAFQMDNPGQALPLQNAELYVFSEPGLRKLLGERNNQAAHSLPDDPLLSAVGLPKYRGITPQMLNRMPGVLATAEDGRSWKSWRLWDIASPLREFNKEYIKDRQLAPSAMPSPFSNASLRLAKRQDVIANARANQSSEQRGVRGDFTRKNLKMAETILQNAANRTMASGDLLPPSSKLLSAIRKQVFTTSAESFQGGFNAVWMVSLDPTRTSRVTGVHTEVTLSEQMGSDGALQADHIAPNDMAILDLSSLDDLIDSGKMPFDQRALKVRNMLRHLSQSGAIVYVLPSQADGDLSIIAAREMQSLGYTSVVGSSNLYSRAEEETPYQASRALRSTLRETTAYTTEDTMALAVISGFAGTTENSLILTNPDGRERFSRLVSPFPLLDYPGYSIPNSPQDVEDVKAAVREIFSDRAVGMELLERLGEVALEGTSGKKAEKTAAKELKDLRRSVDRLLSRWDESEQSNPGTILHVAGQSLRIGDIIPLLRNLDGRKELIFVRAGHVALTPAQLKAQLAVAQEEFGISIAISPLETDGELSFSTGRVQEWVSDSRIGLRAIVRTKLQNVMDKLIDEFSAFKFVTTASDVETKRLPTGDMLPGLKLDGVVNLDSEGVIDKEMRLLTDAQSIFAFVGVEFYSELGRHFFKENLADLSPEEQGALRTKVDNLLLTIRNSNFVANESLLIDFVNSLATSEELLNILENVDTKDVLADAWQVDTALQATEFSNSSDQEAIDARISMAAILYMMLPGADISHIIETSGHGHPSVQGQTPAGRGRVVVMPSIFTQLFDRAKIDSPLRQYVVENKLQPRLGKGFQINPDYSFTFTGSTTVKQKGKTVSVPYSQQGWMAAPKLVPADDNPGITSQAYALSKHQQVSVHSAAVASGSAGLHTVYRNDLSPALAEMESKNIIQALTPANLMDLFTFSGGKGATTTMVALMSEAETHYVSVLAREAANEFRRPLDRSQWEASEISLRHEAATRIAAILGVDVRWLESGVLDFWVRQNAGTTWEGISYARDKEELELIETNLSKGLLPTIGGSIPNLHAADLMALYKASILKGGSWRLKAGLATTELAGQSFDEWVIAAHTQVMEDPGHAEQLHLTAIDGFRHTYATVTNALGSIPITLDTKRTIELIEQESQDLIVSIDPNRNIRLEAPVVLDGTAITPLESQQGQDYVYRYTAQPESESLRGRRHKEVMAYYKENNIPVPMQQTMKSIRANGVILLEQTNSVNTLLRMLTNLRFITAMGNPALYPAAIIESWARASTSDLAGLLTGSSLGMGGALAGRLEAFLGDTPMSQSVRDSAKNVVIAKGASSNFLSMVYEGISPRHELSATAGKAERWLHKASSSLGRVMNDPLYGMRQTSAARRYLEAVIRHYAMTPGNNNMTPERVIAAWSTNDRYFETHDFLAHQAGLNAIADVRSLRPTVAALAVNGAIGAFTGSSGVGRQITGHVLGRWPVMFATFGLNMSTRILGLQGVDAALATVLHGRRNIFAKPMAKIRGDLHDPDTPTTFDMNRVTVGTDLAEKFMQGAVSHASLLLLGLVLQGFGAAGEDEETRRMRRLASAQGVPFIYDPNDIQNSFLNSDAVFLDSLPFGLSSIFSVGEGRAMANPHWAIKPFLSPLIGMNKFFDTGDPMQIVYGFEDAIGSFPLVNENTYFQGVRAFQELQAAAEEASSYGNSESLPVSTALFLSSVMALESMMFESSFVNAIYVGMDKLDRDNYKIPALNEGESSGKWARNKLNQPIPTDALEQYINEYGEVMQGYATRDNVDAAMHGYAENRLGFALMMSLFTGQGFELADSTYLRRNMVPKTRKIPLNEISEMEAKGLILSQWDSGLGRETLTDAGARAVFEGIRAKTVMPNSPSLEGIFIPWEMRERIAAEWVTEIFTEARLQGMSESAAKNLANEIFWGPYGQPEIQGLNDLIFSSEISSSPTAEYYQLNTTYTIGPDGRPWATGVERDNLLNIFLAVPLTRYHTGDSSNLDVDGRLSSVDQVAGINTGLRALTRVDDSWEIPTPEALTKRLEDAIAEAAKDINEVLKAGAFPGGSGGGGGRSSGSRISVPRANTPYANDLQRVSVGSPLLRRASVRRERFDSQKGRLKPWQ